MFDENIFDKIRKKICSIKVFRQKYSLDGNGMEKCIQKLKILISGPFAFAPFEKFNVSEFSKTSSSL